MSETQSDKALVLRSDAEALWATGALGKGKQKPKLLFAQVHEDAIVESSLLASHPNPQRAFCIASGGCTAFSLLIEKPIELHAVDINPTQVYLSLLKREALLQLPYEEALSCITKEASSVYPALRDALPNEARAFWEEHVKLLSLGLGNCGVIERNMQRAMKLFRLFIHGKKTIQAMLGQKTRAEQEAFYKKRFDSWRFRAAFSIGLSRPLLRLVYGKDALRDLPKDFASQMKRQIDEVFLGSPIWENGYLWQLFLGCYPETQAALPLYLQKRYNAQVKEGLARATLTHAEASAFLREHPKAYDFLALSNILEVSTPEMAKALLSAAKESARPGAMLCLRAIFPPRPYLQSLFSELGFSQDEGLAQKARSQDTSPFCRYIMVLRVT